MAKISVSLPDELKDRLEAFATDIGLKRSAAVAHILEVFFADQIADPNEAHHERLAELDNKLDQVMDYIEDLHAKDPGHYARPEWLPATGKTKRRRTRSFIRRRS